MGFLYIFGETHGDPSDVRRIERETRRIQPAVIAHELLYDDRCASLAGINFRLSKCKKGGICDPDLNKDIYELGRDLNAQLIGIDIEVDNPRLSLKQKFAIRERHMSDELAHLLKRVEAEDIDIVAVVGDTHLRSIQTKELGPSSPIVQKFSYSKKVVINRSTSSQAEIP